MTRWWRAYDEAVDDPKLIMLTDRQHRAWFNLCCITSQNHGVLPTLKVIALKLRMAPEKAKDLVAQLTALGLIDHDDVGTFAPHNWDGRQYKSDVTDSTAAQRARKYRDKRRALRSASRDANVTRERPDTDTDTDTERKKEVPAADAALEPVDEDPKAKLYRIGKTALVSFGIAEKRTGALIGQWLKTRNDPAGLLAAIQYARDQNVAEPIAYISTLVSKASTRNGQFGKQSLSDRAFELADEFEAAERSRGLERSPNRR